MNSNRQTMCPVCGYPALDEPPYDDSGCPTYVICPCCGNEFGYDDTSVAHVELRKKWIKKGMPWWSKRINPPDKWDPTQQLKEAKLFD